MNSTSAACVVDIHAGEGAGCSGGVACVVPMAELRHSIAAIRKPTSTRSSSGSMPRT